MIGYIGEHFDILVLAAMAIFAAILFITSVEDAATARSRENKG